MRRAVLLSALAFVSCREAPEAVGSRHVVLITIDTIRSDYVGYSGAGKVKTPHLDRLAEEGVAFTETRSPVPLTMPAHASILTGAYPPAHGVRVNGRDRLSENDETLAEILKGKGYATAAFVGAFVLDRRFGLAQGFDVYDDQMGSDVRLLENIEAERDGGAVASAFSGWLSRQTAEQPFFAWIHFYDPHAPYEPPEPYRSQYPNDPYAGEVAYTDEVVGRVMADLQSRGLLERALVAVVGDHGEGLGDHGEQTHSVLIYNSTLHVPFLLYAPGLIDGGRKVDAVTRTVDVAPTLLDYLGLPTPMAQGKTLRPLVEGRSDATESGESAYSESLYASIHLGWSELRGLERGGFRYIEAPRPELYDLRADPGEREDLLSSRKALAREMQSELEQIEGELGGDSTPESGVIDSESEARLRSLGYVSASSPRPSHQKAVDPKEHMALWNELQIGIHEFGQRNYVGAIEILQKVLATEKDIPLVYENLGALYMQVGRHAEAETIYRQALARGMEDADFHVNLGLLYHYRREWTEAEKELRLALGLDPGNVAALVHLGNTLRAGGQPEEAISQYQKALEINPNYLYAFDGLGIAHSKLGQQEEALRSFREVVRLDPEGAQGHFNLAVQLEQMGRRAEALEAYRELLRRSSTGAPPELTRRATAAVERLEAPASKAR
jgi:arylsulfatase A-like enzyme/Flp pilus assembly protein TadD